MTLLYIIAFTAFGGILSILAASVFLFLPEPTRSKLLPHCVSFAIGALLAVAFWGLIPHALEAVSSDQIQTISGTLLGGILLFFLLEKLLIWRHCHSSHCEAHIHEDIHGHEASGTLIILGDSIHNFVDGILIGAAFLTNTNLGIVTSLAVAAHEIPQEVGDFAIMLHSGYSRNKALIFNILASLTTVLGGILAYFWLGDMQQSLPYILALAASSFIYVAVADLIPTLHKRTDIQSTVKQIILIGLGVLLICSLDSLIHEEEPHLSQINKMN
ncbi:MAG: ZIP family metal transporter [Methylococcaceae bacterium]